MKKITSLAIGTVVAIGLGMAQIASAATLNVTNQVTVTYSATGTGDTAQVQDDITVTVNILYTIDTSSLTGIGTNGGTVAPASTDNSQNFTLTNSSNGPVQATLTLTANDDADGDTTAVVDFSGQIDNSGANVGPVTNNTPANTVYQLGGTVTAGNVTVGGGTTTFPVNHGLYFAVGDTVIIDGNPYTVTAQVDGDPGVPTPGSVTVNSAAVTVGGTPLNNGDPSYGLAISEQASYTLNVTDVGSVVGADDGQISFTIDAAFQDHLGAAVATPATVTRTYTVQGVVLTVVKEASSDGVVYQTDGALVTGVDSGETIYYRITITNPSASSNALADAVNILDVLSPFVTYVPATFSVDTDATVGGTTGVLDGTDDGLFTGVLTGTNLTITPTGAITFNLDDTIIITYQVTVL